MVVELFETAYPHSAVVLELAFVETTLDEEEEMVQEVWSLVEVCVERAISSLLSPLSMQRF